MDALQIPDDATPRFERIGEEFLASIYKAAMERQPDNLAALAELGHVYTRLGRYQDGLEVDSKLVEIDPTDPTVRYNLACSQSLVGNHAEALATLEAALDLGFDDLRLLSEDSDLDGVRSDPRFRALVERLSDAG